MKPRTTGAWIIGHSNKLRRVETQGQFGNIDAAGKAGVMLSIFSAAVQTSLSRVQVETLANANGIGKLELPGLLDLLVDRHVIQKSSYSGGVEILGLTQGTVLEKTAEMFEGMSPSAEEHAVVGIAELVSGAPVRSTDLRTYVSDTFKLRSARAADLLEQSEKIGFLDAEELDAVSRERLYFNGNIFRVKDAKKMQSVLTSLGDAEQRKVREFDASLRARGYATVEEARLTLGEKLFEKLQAIALYDVSQVANGYEQVNYITRPGSFCKYGNPWEEDTLDYAKALVACLAYGMTRSSSSRGRIRLLTALLAKLNRGEWLGESTAAGEDYRFLEFKRVVEIRSGQKFGWQMRLLKREVGVVALEVLTAGEDSSEALLEKLPVAPVHNYIGPEQNRTQIRRKEIIGPSDRKVADMLLSLRTGRL